MPPAAADTPPALLLDDDACAHVLGLLDVASFGRGAQVCVQWRRVTLDGPVRARQALSIRVKQYERLDAQPETVLTAGGARVSSSRRSADGKLYSIHEVDAAAAMAYGPYDALQCWQQERPCDAPQLLNSVPLSADLGAAIAFGGARDELVVLTSWEGAGQVRHSAAPEEQCIRGPLGTDRIGADGAGLKQTTGLAVLGDKVYTCSWGGQLCCYRLGDGSLVSSLGIFPAGDDSIWTLATDGRSTLYVGSMYGAIGVFSTEVPASCAVSAEGTAIADLLYAAAPGAPADPPPPAPAPPSASTAPAPELAVADGDAPAPAPPPLRWPDGLCLYPRAGCLETCFLDDEPVGGGPGPASGGAHLDGYRRWSGLSVTAATAAAAHGGVHEMLVSGGQLYVVCDDHSVRVSVRIWCLDEPQHPRLLPFVLDLAPAHPGPIALLDGRLFVGGYARVKEEGNAISVWDVRPVEEGRAPHWVGKLPSPHAPVTVLRAVGERLVSMDTVTNVMRVW